MMELLKKYAFVGLGLAALSAENVKKLGKQIAKESKMSEEEGKKLVQDLLAQSEKSKEQMRKKVEEVVKGMDLPTKKDFDKLSAKLDEIEKKVSPETTRGRKKA